MKSNHLEGKVPKSACFVQHYTYNLTFPTYSSEEKSPQLSIVEKKYYPRMKTLEKIRGAWGPHYFLMFLCQHDQLVPALA